MTPPHSHHTPACSGPRPASSAGALHSTVRVKGSAGPVKGELEVTASGPQAAPLSTAIAILVLVTASALATVALSVAGWLAGLPALATGLGACGFFAMVFGVGVYIAYPPPARRSEVRPADPPCSLRFATAAARASNRYARALFR
jgi:hypothetical protein